MSTTYNQTYGSRKNCFANCSLTSFKLYTIHEIKKHPSFCRTSISGLMVGYRTTRINTRRSRLHYSRCLNTALWLQNYNVVKYNINFVFIIHKLSLTFDMCSSVLIEEAGRKKLMKYVWIRQINVTNDGTSITAREQCKNDNVNAVIPVAEPRRACCYLINSTI